MAQSGIAGSYGAFIPSFFFYILHFVYSFCSGHLGCLHFLAIMNNAMSMQLSFSDSAFNSFGYIYRSGTVGSYGSFDF